jgi:RNA recognition motif-containing protein
MLHLGHAQGPAIRTITAGRGLVFSVSKAGVRSTAILGRLFASGRILPATCTQGGGRHENPLRRQSELPNHRRRAAKAVEHVTISRDRLTGNSRSFAFVEMQDEAAAEAILALNGSKLGDRTINVNEARPRAARADTGRGRGERRFGRS